MKFRKFLSALLVMVLFVGILPLAVSAETATTVYECDFEDDAWMNEYYVVDFDQDGNSWLLIDNAESGAEGLKVHSGHVALGSLSFDNSSGSALTPDNWLITPAIQMPADATSIEASVWACGQDDSWAAEVFAIGVMTEAAFDAAETYGDLLNALDTIGGDFTCTGNWQQFSGDASAYAGQSVHIVIRHYNVTDMFLLNIDDIAVTATVSGEPQEANIELEAELIEGGVQLNWVDADEKGAYDIFRKASGDSEWALIGSSTEPTYDDTTVNVKTTYDYKVANELGDSNVASVTTGTFLDVLPSDSSYKAVDWAVEQGIVSGTSPTTFSPKVACTRSQFALMLYRLAGKPEVDLSTNPFTDLPNNSGIKKAIVWAYNEGIVNGTSATTYSPNNNITRAQLVIMLWKMAGKPSVEGLDCPFTDLAGLTANNKKAVTWAFNEGIVKGTSATTFGPKANCTRGQLVIMLYRYNKLFDLVPYSVKPEFQVMSFRDALTRSAARSLGAKAA